MWIRVGLTAVPGGYFAPSGDNSLAVNREWLGLNNPSTLAPMILTLDIKNPHYIRFPMEDGTTTVTVHISTSSLRECAARDGCVVSNVAILYSAYREAIEAAASLQYDRGTHRDNADIVVAGISPEAGAAAISFSYR